LPASFILQIATKCKRKVRFALLVEKSYNREDRNAGEKDQSFMGNLPLEGLKGVDIAVLFASPTISQDMGDFRFLEPDLLILAQASSVPGQ
jgi:hypothetical protein